MKSMKKQYDRKSTFVSRLLAALVFVSMATSCAKDPVEDNSKYENLALEAWMTQHRPKLVDNFQAAGNSGFYVDVISEGDADAAPIGDKAQWVRFDATARDLNGNLVLTRNAADAKLLNTFTRYTRYVPFYRYCGTENAGLLEGVWLAMTQPLKLDNGAREVKLRINAKVDLYLPSILFGGSLSGSGGYEGETTLSGNRPVILHMEIKDTVVNPLSREGQDVDKFCEDNGGLLRYVKPGSAEISSGAVTIPEPSDDPVNQPNHPYNPATPRWVSACDSVAQLYVNYRYNPAASDVGDKWTYQHVYKNEYVPYNQPEALHAEIDKALAERFPVETPVGKLEADSVGLEGTAKIWYVGRFLDGFVFDTNIDEVKELIYGTGYTAGSVLSYTPSDGGLIQAFYYTVPRLKYGQWASLITVSTNAYGSSGQTGSTTTSTSGGNTSSYYDYLNYMSYMNSYYNGYYGGYYNNYYGNYWGGYYGGYYDDYSSDTSQTVTTTTVTTEIPSFTPLIFQIYVEPK